MNRGTLSREELLNALRVKAKERDSVATVENYEKHLRDIANSPEIAKIWVGYVKSYPYAKGIALPDILTLIIWVFEG